MKKKIGTLLEEELVQGAKKVSVAKHIKFNQVIENALEDYIAKQTQQGLLSLNDILNAKPGSVSNRWEGSGAGDMTDEDFD
jgi:hypothetical protein